MKVRITTFTAAILCVSIFSSLSAQSTKWEQRWQESIDALEQTEFIKEYKANKMVIERQLEDFVRQSATLHPEDVEAVRKSYVGSLAMYDKILDELKNDFTDTETQKYLAKNPDRYTQSLAWQLTNANEYYSDNVQQKIDRLINRSDGAMIGLMEVGLLISLTKEILGIIQAQKGKMKELRAAYFENNFLVHLRLKRWESY